MILSDYLRHILQAHKRLAQLESAKDYYLRSRYDPDTGFLDDPTPPAVVLQLTQEIGAYSSTPSPIRQQSLEEKQVPDAFLQAYDLLYTSAYGTGALVIGDPNKIHESGKPLRARTSSSQTQKRGGAVEKKRLSASQKNIIRSEPAFHLKRRIDKRLRSLAREIYEELNSSDANVL